jgi:hypothetical protein
MCWNVSLPEVAEQLIHLSLSAVGSTSCSIRCGKTILEFTVLPLQTASGWLVTFGINSYNVTHNCSVQIPMVGVMYK